jgi:hypothetical protein
MRFSAPPAALPLAVCATMPQTATRGPNLREAITPVKFSRASANALALRGIATDYRIVLRKGDDLLNDQEVLAAPQRLAASLPRKT